MRISDWSSDVCSSDLGIADYRACHALTDAPFEHTVDGQRADIGYELSFLGCERRARSNLGCNRIHARARQLQGALASIVCAVGAGCRDVAHAALNAAFGRGVCRERVVRYA